MTRLTSSIHQRIGVGVLVFLSSISIISAQQRTTRTDAPSPEQMKELGKYPLKDLGEVLNRLQKDVVVPAPRQESRLLPLLPGSTVFYAAIPNYGDAAKQALGIFREERESRPELRKWWRSPEMAKSGPQFEMAVEAVSNLAQYVGDEIVAVGSVNGSKSPSFALLAEVRKPGLKAALDFAVQLASGGSKPSVRILDNPGLASAIESTPRQFTILIRPDFVIAAPDLETVRNFSRQLDTGKRDFAAKPFGQRLQRGYVGGVAVIAGADLETILSQTPLPAQQGQILQQTGFGDMKYAVWEHRGLPGQPSSEGELSFTRPRRALASWLAAPRDLRSLDFASPQAILVASIALKNLGSIFDDVQTLATSSNPNAFAQMDQMQQGLGINLKDDLLSQLGGEITLEVDNIEKDHPAWKAILQVNDPARVEQTFSKLLAVAPLQARQSIEAGITYHNLTVPSPAKPTEIGYAFADGFLVIASSDASVREAVRLHLGGESLARSSAFRGALPDHSTQASALYYQDPIRLMGMQLSRLSPELGNSPFHGSAATSPTVTCAYADETTIRSKSMSQAFDASTILIAAAAALPNLLRAKNSSNEAAALANMQRIMTAQTAYSNAYPARGYARDLASLGSDPNAPGVYTPKHAGLLDMALAKPECKVGAWCEKSGYNFTFGQACPKLLCQEFVAVATPVAVGTGSRSFCVTSEGVIRYNAMPPFSGSITVKECKQWQPLE
jgi:type II secretory pathway pseudopilin PulG